MPGRDDELAELIEAVRARDDFIAVAAHELRNPMTPMVMQLSMLDAALRRMPNLPPRVAAMVDRLKSAMDSYVRRANVLLDVARMTSGRMTPELTEVELSDLVLESLAIHGPVAAAAGSTVIAEVDPGLRCWLDRLAVEQIIDNLVSNAIKYGRGNPVHVGVSRHAGVVTLYVRDQGEGIPAADQARIFERFERVVAHGRPHGGFGIGLWVVRQLIEAMEGTIAVESAPGEGSVFTVTLPCEPPAVTPGIGSDHE